MSLSDPTYIISIADLVAIDVELPRIDSGYSLEKDFTKLICINLLIVLCQIVNQVGSCHSYICGPLT